MYASETIGLFDIPSLILDYYKTFIAITVGLFFATHECKCGHLEGLLRFSDKHSYSIYLVHNIFVLGALSVMTLTPYLSINISIAVLATFIFGVIISELSKHVTNLFCSRC